MTIKVTYNVTDVYMSQSVSPVYITVSYSDGGASGGGVWGTITGTLSNQTDLQNALDGKFDDPTGTTAQYIRGDGTLATFPALTGYVPYTGATTNVDLGEYELKAGQLTLDTSPTGTAAVGTTRWNDTTGTSETTLKGGSVVLKNGVDLVARVVNKVTPNTTLTKAAYQAVRVSGAQGQRLAVALAQANNDTNSADTIGLVTETIATNQEGFIMTMGQLENINTTGSLQGETWVDGDVLYLSPTTAGAITNVQPTGSGHIVVIGYVEYAHANNGKIYVKVLNGWELTELHDTEIISPANNEALIYETSTALWKNKTIATALGFTPANAATTLTINGVTYDLSTSRTWTIAAGISGSGTAGQVTYWTGASAVSGSNNLFWDETNSRLGIGTNVPTSRLHLSGSTTAASAIARGVNFRQTLVAAANSDILVGVDINPIFTTTPYSSVNTLGLRVLNGAVTIGTSDYTYKEINSGNYDGVGIFSISGSTGKFQIVDAGATSQSWNFVQENSTSARIRYASINAQMVSNTAGAETGILRFFTKSSGSSVSEALRIWSNQNVLIQNAGTYSDLGYRLGVIGDTLLRGSGATSATTALTVQNSASTNLFVVRNDGNVGIGTNAPLTPFHVVATDATLLLRNTSSTGYSGINMLDDTNTLTGSFQIGGSGTGATLAGHMFIGARKSGGHLLFVRGSGATISGGLFSTGNFGFGFTTDPAVRLGVSGDTLLRGSGATSATTALTVQNSSSTNLLTVRNDNRVTIRNSWIEPYQSGSPNDAIKLVSNNLGASIGVQNENATGYSGIEYLSNAGVVRVFTGLNNNNGSEFRFNNLATNGYITFMINATQAMTIKTNRQVRFHPLALAPSGAEAGDVYYNSTDNKHYGYNGTTWNAFY